jgi:hypothetical protein
VGRYCEGGFPREGAPLVLEGGAVWLHFVSDGSRESWGWAVTVRALGGADRISPTAYHGFGFPLAVRAGRPFQCRFACREGGGGGGGGGEGGGGDRLVLRAAPALTAEQVGALRNGERLMVSGRAAARSGGGGWLRATTAEGVSGWAPEAFEGRRCLFPSGAAQGGGGDASAYDYSYRGHESSGSGSSGSDSETESSSSGGEADGGEGAEAQHEVVANARGFVLQGRGEGNADGRAKAKAKAQAQAQVKAKAEGGQRATSTAAACSAGFPLCAQPGAGAVRRLAALCRQQHALLCAPAAGGAGASGVGQRAAPSESPAAKAKGEAKGAAAAAAACAGALVCLLRLLGEHLRALHADADADTDAGADAEGATNSSGAGNGAGGEEAEGGEAEGGVHAALPPAFLQQTGAFLLSLVEKGVVPAVRRAAKDAYGAAFRALHPTAAQRAGQALELMQRAAAAAAAAAAAGAGAGADPDSLASLLGEVSDSAGPELVRQVRRMDMALVPQRASAVLGQVLAGCKDRRCPWAVRAALCLQGRLLRSVADSAGSADSADANGPGAGGPSLLQTRTQARTAKARARAAGRTRSGSNSAFDALVQLLGAAQGMCEAELAAARAAAAAAAAAGGAGGEGGAGAATGGGAAGGGGLSALEVWSLLLAPLLGALLLLPDAVHARLGSAWRLWAPLRALQETLAERMGLLEMQGLRLREGQGQGQGQGQGAGQLRAGAGVGGGSECGRAGEEATEAAAASDGAAACAAMQTRCLAVSESCARLLLQLALACAALPVRR